MPNSHPDLDLLTEYSAGSLPLAHSACVGVHVSLCDQCRRLSHQLADLGAAMFEQLESAPLGEESLDALMARLDEQPPLVYGNSTGADGATPAILQRLMGGDFSELEWKKFGSKLRICPLRTGDPHREFALYHIQPGGKIPEHTHRGSEMTQVLQGSFSDVEGNYHHGDFVFRGPEHNHAPTAGQSQDCICLVVLDAPLKFTDWKFRWMNPFLTLRTA